jgi:polyhydroxyalkanoate synthesis regulator phasin
LTPARGDSGLPVAPSAAMLRVIMIELIKKTLLAGVGATIVTKEKVEEALQDYIRQGKVTAGDARIMAEKIAEQGRREFETMSAELAAKFREMAEKADFTQRARIEALEARVKKLEAALAARSGPGPGA